MDLRLTPKGWRAADRGSLHPVHIPMVCIACRALVEFCPEHRTRTLHDCRGAK